MIPKFRAWHKELERLMSVQIIWLDEGEISELELNDSLMNESIPVYRDEVALMQSTGLFDKNGKEVYIGDIVKCTSGCFHEVIFLKEYDGRYIGGMPAIYLSDIREGYMWTEDEEIIGNIYENPELVEG
ncbi:TPA: hypothetical protein TZS69_002091 [Streptococcus suis]|nr:hypothetical protein [Streptococcus suis]